MVQGYRGISEDPQPSYMCSQVHQWCRDPGGLVKTLNLATCVLRYISGAGIQGD